MEGEERGRLSCGERLEELNGYLGQVMPECGQDKGLQVLSTEAQSTEGGTQLITEQPLWLNENQIGEGHALRINQGNGGRFLKEALASFCVSSGSLEL